MREGERGETEKGEWDAGLATGRQVPGAPHWQKTGLCDTGVLSRVLWLVGPLKLRVTIQLTLSLRLLKMHCD